jgi:cytochrome c oxidase subunit 2
MPAARTRRIPARSLVALIAVLAVLTLSVSSPHKAAAEESPRVIEITAKRFGFTPNQITLKKGEAVRFRLTSEDVTHGFFLRPLKVDEEIAPGKTTEVTVTPQAAGTFSLICDHFCGVNHGNMKMTIVVVE